MSRTKRLGLLAAPSLIVYWLVHLAMWPAQMSPDSFTQWMYVVRPRAATDLHSTVHFALIWLLTRVWYSPAVVVLTQIASLSLVTALILDELRMWSVPAWAIAIAAILFPLFPANLFLSTVVWIDVPHAVATLLCFHCLLTIARQNGEPMYRRAFVVRFTLILLLLAFLRQNGILAAVLTAGLIAAAYRSKATAIAFLIVLLVPYPVRQFGYAALGTAPLPNSFKGIPPLHVLSAYAAEGKLLPETTSTVAAIAPIDFLASSYHCDVESAFYDDRTNRDFIQNHLGELYRAALENVRANPSVYLRHFACVTEFLWKPATFTPRTIGYPPLGIYDGTPDGSSARAFGIEFRPILPALRENLLQFFAWTTDPSRVWLFWRPAIPLYFIVAIAAFLVVRLRRGAMFLLAIPAIAQTLSIAPLIVGPAYRYQYGVTTMALLIWPLLLQRRIVARRERERPRSGTMTSSTGRC